MATILFLVLVVATLCVAPSRGQVSYCPAYTATNTASATTNYVTCTINVCNGYYTIGMCADGGTFSGDTYLILVSSTGTVLAENDDKDEVSCDVGSEVQYNVTTGCQALTLRQGCLNAESCGGTVSISKGILTATATPSRAPSRQPTSGSAVPTATPSAAVPTAVPTASSAPSPVLSSSPTSPAEASSLNHREKSLIVLAITLPAVVVGLSLLLIPVYCFFFANQMSAQAPSIKDTPSIPTAIAPATANSSVPEKEVVYDVLAAEDNTANI